MRRLSVRFSLLSILTLALVALGAMTVLADDNLDSTKYDGRLNQAEWLGNHAVYCVDHNGLPTSDGWDDGGIRVLDGNGQVVFFAPAAEIDDVGDVDVNTLVHAEGGLSLYAQPDGGFSLNGVDDGGSAYTFVFYDCVPVGPVPYTHATIFDPCARKPQVLIGPQTLCPG